ncbi:hypothetical protein [Georgenia sp. SUBG003]
MLDTDAGPGTTAAPGDVTPATTAMVDQSEVAQPEGSRSRA